MKNTMRKLFSLALVVVMLACAIPFSAFALSELEQARLDQAEATKVYNNELQVFNNAKNNLEAAKTAKNNTEIALANALTARNSAASAVTAATTAEADAYNAYVAAGSVAGSAEYNTWAAAQAAKAAAEADYSAKQAALETAQADATYAATLLGNRQDEYNTARSAYNNAVLLKNAADEAVRVAEANQSASAAKKASLRLNIVDQNGNTITTINRDLETTNAFDLATLIPAGYTFVSMKTGVTSSIVPLTEGQNNRTIIVKPIASSTVTPPSTTTETATLRLIVADENGNTISNKTYTGLAVTSAYDLKNLIPSGYTFLRMKSGDTSSIVPLTAGQNNRTVIVKANSNSISGGSNTSGGIWLGNNNDVVNKDPWPVYLNIYLNGNVSTIAKKVDITKGIAADGYVDLEDVKTVVKSYFNAKDSDGIQYDGLYIFDGSFGGQYTTDVGRVDGYGNINEDRKLSTVNINVMIKNAVAKGSVAADTSNPKTGDMAFLTVTALVASAGALALVYANKKRFLVK